MEITIRPYRTGDLDVLQRITVESFDGIALDQMVEEKLGFGHERDWRWRKARHIAEDVEANGAGTFVAEGDGQIVGYITTVLDRAAGKGRIPNLAVAGPARGQGLGRKLIEHALGYFRQEGMAYAMIETMEENEVGKHLYPACGFVEIARQIHFGLKL
jgi:ribosomal protein S18 acetylase RimI-like enzyme